MNNEFQWAEEMNCAVTVSDFEGNLIYMNEMSRKTFCKPGETMVGKNMMGCHSERSQGIIKKMLSEGCSNAYTIDKKGVKKLIYQTPWRVNGEVKGLVEISMIIPEDMPHYVRK
ncbi:MAG: PAS sensor protein [Prevotella sp.]|nr:PAS sensor protein [Prevotella sp.]MBR1620948.1 PAS sensor protein [Prevotella sp.]